MSKNNLDQLMTEYDYIKNDLESTIDFLEFMSNEYLKLWSKQKGEK